MDADGTASRLSGERLEILRLVENQTISADEGSKLLEALDRSDMSFPSFPAPPAFDETASFAPAGRGPAASRARNVRIRITDSNSGDMQLNLVLPYGLLDSGLKMAKRIAPDRMLDAKEIRESVEDGFIGHILDIVDDDTRVEILIEPRDGPAAGFTINSKTRR
jgi:hypothetical protein